MKVKLLKKLRKRFQVWKIDNLYYPVDNDSLHWDYTFPYKYLPSEDLNKALEKRRELILQSAGKKTKIII